MSLKTQRAARWLLLTAGVFVAQTAHAAEPTPSLQAPATAGAGSKVAVRWTGPGKGPDQIGVLPAGSPDNTAPKGYPCYPFGHNPAYCVLPEAPGEYELRYFPGGGAKVAARRRLTVLPVTATVEAPATATAGSQIAVRWTGPNDEYDTITFVSAQGKHAGGSPNYTSIKGNPMHIPVPEQAGEYELQYLSGKGRALGRARVTVTSASAVLNGPAQVTAGSAFKVSWQGPAGEYDRVVLAEKGAPDRKSASFDFTSKGSPLTLAAPATTGDYELRYQTGQTGSILARAPLKVTPGKLEPGLVHVTQGGGRTLSTPGSVEILLDASGSMLQRIGAERRIDIAKHTLAKLVSEIVPAGTPFALRVLGRGADTCQSELDVPLGPLERAAVTAKLASLEARNNAKTPLGASLEKVAADLSSAHGERLVILVTDGEETCGGNPASAIKKLEQAGLAVRVNIVGFALDDERTKSALELWSEAGGGSYFDARDAQSLSDAFSRAVKPSFEIADASKHVVARGSVAGDPVRLLPGTYSVSLKGSQAPARSVTVRPRETTTVQF